MKSPLVYALIGEEVDVVDGSVLTALNAVRAAGWTPESLRAHRIEAARWPHPVPDEVRGDVGFAQLKSQIDDVVSTWRLSGPTAVAMDRMLSAHEQRLADDVPPHFGKI